MIWFVMAAKVVIDAWVFLLLMEVVNAVAHRLGRARRIDVSGALTNLRPFYFASFAVFTVYVATRSHLGIDDIVGLGSLAVMGFAGHGGDDDRWRRRRRKVKDRIMRRLGRLVTTPAPNPA